jgi:glutamyl-tRNA synthetase
VSDSHSRTVRTRFAPSPTGPLHVGGVRSALFGWLLARHHGGQFILRIEDTDQKRYDPQATELVINGLKWLGVDWDEGPDIGGPHEPYIQSGRLHFYGEWVQWLVDNGRAYRAYDTPEELAQINEKKKSRNQPTGYDGRHRDLTSEQEQEFLNQGRRPVIRFRAPHEGKTVCNDLIHGLIEFDNHTLQDIVLLKSDGYPTYHLAHVIDDHLMQITHVTRSNEWIPSLPIHVQLWQAFGWEMPYYAHLPVLLNPNGKGKLSKRHAGASHDGQQYVPQLLTEFQAGGYLPEAVVNFLINIGWNFGDEREVFSVHEAIERFDITEVNPANSAYPIEKLAWLNGIYIREKLSSAELARHLRQPLESAGLNVDENLLHKIVPLVQTRINTLQDLVGMAGFFFREEFRPPTADELIQKKMDAQGTQDALQAAYNVLVGLDDFSTDVTHAAMQELAQQLGLKNNQLFGSLRVAITGQTVSPPTFETMEVLGKAESLRRVGLAIEILGENVLTDKQGT